MIMFSLLVFLLCVRWKWAEFRHPGWAGVTEASESLCEAFAAVTPTSPWARTDAALDALDRAVQQALLRLDLADGMARGFLNYHSDAEAEFAAAGFRTVPAYRLDYKTGHCRVAGRRHVAA